MEFSPPPGGSPPITVLDLGARIIDGRLGPYCDLPTTVPGSRVIAVDMAPGCQYPDGWEAHQVVVAGTSGKRTFYHNLVDTTSSLYPLNWRFLQQYSGLASLATIRTEQVDVVGLDEFTANLRPIHFLHADIQGAEGETFNASPRTLADVLMVFAEVFYAPVYVGIPLFGELTDILAKRGFAFYDASFLARYPESPYPVVSEGRLLWGDAIYIRDDIRSLDTDGLHRLSLLAHRYYRFTLAAMCVSRADGSAAGKAYLNRIIAEVKAIQRTDEKEKE